MRNDIVGPIVSERDDGSSEEPGCIHGCTRKILLIEVGSVDCRRHNEFCGGGEALLCGDSLGVLLFEMSPRGEGV